MSLFTTLPPGTLAPPHLLKPSDLLFWTEEIMLGPVGEGAYPCGGDPDVDLQDWAQRLFRLPRRPMNVPEGTQAGGGVRAAPAGASHIPPRAGTVSRFHAADPALGPRLGNAESLWRFFGSTAKLNDYILADSRSTKSDASWLCDVPQERIIAQYPGPSMCVRHHAHTAPVQRAKRTILVVSTLEPRKNGPFLMEWFLKTDVLAPARN